MGGISIKNLCVSYGALVVLEHIDLDVANGEFVSLVGPSGCGKTTLLNALAGFIPASGQINVPHRIGIVFQDYSVFPWMTVAENIGFGLNHGNGVKSDVVREHLRMVRLEDRADKYPAELSGGQVQRVGIARALAPKPAVVFMDEPYGALDRETRERMQKWLLEVWNEDHKTIIFVTHDMEEAIFLSDRVVVLKNKTVGAEFVIPFPRPRTEELKFSSEFIGLKKTVLCELRS
ncbi:MAG TPA: ABC transporter ATP-binding protein [Pyrinomonadaceae bacterium]|nr:ABC transporter ATP-binding protein [Pyrinomonadaceae bacterium]